MDDLKQALYLIADEMRGHATLSKRFAESVYSAERAERLMELAAQVAALADDDHTPAEVKAIFEAEPWLRISPALGVEAAVFNAHGEILLIQRRDNGKWALPGGIAEIGQTLPESALRELWEEAGLRGQVTRLLGIFDGRLWGSRSAVHLIHPVFEVVCDDLAAVPGIECLDAQFFARDQLPAAMHHGHDRRVPLCFELRNSGIPYFDPADSTEAVMPMHQRPDSQAGQTGHAPAEQSD